MRRCARSPPTLKRNGIDGVIATNTTVARDAVQGLPHADEAGGLSGAPVFASSNRVIAALRAELGAKTPIIGVGGVLSGDDAARQARRRRRPRAGLHRADLPGPVAGARARRSAQGRPVGQRAYDLRGAAHARLPISPAVIVDVRAELSRADRQRPQGLRLLQPPLHPAGSCARPCARWLPTSSSCRR